MSTLGKGFQNASQGNPGGDQSLKPESAGRMRNCFCRNSKQKHDLGIRGEKVPSFILNTTYPEVVRKRRHTHTQTMHASYCTESCRNSCNVDGNQLMIYIILFCSLGKTIYVDKNLEKVIMKKLFPFSCINFLILKLNQGRESIDRPPCCSQDQVASFTQMSAVKMDKATKCLFLLRRSKYTFLSPYVGTTYQSCSQPYFQHVKKFLYKQTPGMSCGVLPSFLILKSLYISKKK